VRLLATVLGAVLIVLMPLAHGSPIDPSTPGFWDGGDFDDVILFLTSHLHPVEIDAAPVISVAQTIVRHVDEPPVQAAPRGSYESGSPRAPPFV
jgi:hypothetical protein